MQMVVSRRRPIHWKLFDQVEYVANHDFRLLVHIDFTRAERRLRLSLCQYVTTY